MTTETLDEKFAREILEAYNKDFLKSGVPQVDIDRIVSKSKIWCDQVRDDEGLSDEIVSSLLILALYDIILFIDDSGSMRREENGIRVEELNKIGRKILSVNMIFRDADPAITRRGDFIKFINSERSPRVHTVTDWDQAFASTSYGGWTRIGQKLKAKVLEPEVYQVIEKEPRYRKERPLLISIITDGKPEPEDENTLKTVLQECKDQLNFHNLGSRAVVFQISQVGNSPSAQKFLHKLDTDPELKDIIDCTSNAELESQRKAQGKLPLLEAERTIKMLAGAMLVDYDVYHKERWDINN